MNNNLVIVKREEILVNSDGDQLVATHIEVSDNYFADVYVHTAGAARLNNGNHLMDDAVFWKSVTDIFRKDGYVGPDISRAESGMQEEYTVIAEPEQVFAKWAKAKYHSKKGK
jgi:hypothetical protein